MVRPYTRKARPKRRKPASKGPKLTVRTEQLAMPAGFLRATGAPATLRQVVSPHVPTVDGAALTPQQRRDLTLLRIEQQDRFVMATIRHGLIDKAQAVEEIRRDSDVGRALVEIEHIAIDLLREEEARRRRARVRRLKAKPRTRKGKRGPR